MLRLFLVGLCAFLGADYADDVAVFSDGVFARWGSLRGLLLLGCYFSRLFFGVLGVRCRGCT
jgi:hypothetical protein